MADGWCEHDCEKCEYYGTKCEGRGDVVGKVRGWPSQVGREPHELEVTGSNPAPRTTPR